MSGLRMKTNRECLVLIQMLNIKRSVSASGVGKNLYLIPITRLIAQSVLRFISIVDVSVPIVYVIRGENVIIN
jgi:hypothetical protein